MGLKTAKAAVPSIDSLFVLKSLEEEVALIGADEALLLGGLRHGRLPLRPEDGANANCACKQSSHGEARHLTGSL